MTRLLIHVEGETEETFVKDVIGPHLHGRGYTKVSARLLGNARQRDRRGGTRSWAAVRKDILNHLREDVGCLASTLVDYYGLPQSGPGAWPGRGAAGQLPFQEKAAAVEDELLTDVCAQMGGGFDRRRFVPYVSMHEFEALLFSDCEEFGRGIGRSDLTPDLQAIRASFGTPEEIDDSPTTAPSKRIEALVEGYQKPLLGTLAALTIGLEAMRAECPHFRSWLERLEHLSASASSEPE